MSRVVIALVLALAACSSSSSQVAYVCIPDAGAPCAIESTCTAANAEPFCASDVNCAVAGECCDADDSGACHAICTPCCLFYGGNPDGVQQMKCQPGGAP